MCPLLALAFMAFQTVRSADSEKPAAKTADKTKDDKAKKDKKLSLFDGKSLEGWKVTKFGGEGEVHVKDGQIVLEIGNDLTGITATKKVPTINYEVSLEAMRLRGSDFFCGLTFPVKDKPCTLIVGGWGGGLCGLSSIGGLDASENETGGYRELVSNRWYRIRLRVTEKKIEAWIDDDKVVDHTLDDRKLSVRLEVELSKPFGIATWQTAAALRKIEIRELDAAPAKGK
jgi:hypothetical protein